MKERKSVRKIKKANISLERIRNWDRKQKLPLWKEKNRKADKRREKKINVSLVEKNRTFDMRKWTDKKIYWDFYNIMIIYNNSKLIKK